MSNFNFEQRILDLKLQAIRQKAGLDALEESNGTNTRNWSTTHQPRQQQQQQQQQPHYSSVFPSIRQQPQPQPSSYYSQPFVPVQTPMQPMFLPDTNSQFKRQQKRRRERQRRQIRVKQEAEQRNMMMMQMAAVKQHHTYGTGNYMLNGNEVQPREDALLSRLDRVLDQNTKLIEGIAHGGSSSGSNRTRRSGGRRRNESSDSSEDEDDHHDRSRRNSNRQQPSSDSNRRRQVSWKQNQPVKTYDGTKNDRYSSSSHNETKQQQVQQQQQHIETIDGSTLDPNNPNTQFHEIEGGSPALQDAKQWFVRRSATSSSLNDTATMSNFLNLESDDDDDNGDEIDFKVPTDNNIDNHEENEKKRRYALKVFVVS